MEPPIQNKKNKKWVNSLVCNFNPNHDSHTGEFTSGGGSEEHADTSSSHKELLKSILGVAGSTAGWYYGSIHGAAIGSSVGSLFGGVGAAPGAFIGGILGGALAGSAASVLTDHVVEGKQFGMHTVHDLMDETVAETVEGVALAGLGKIAGKGIKMARGAVAGYLKAGTAASKELSIISKQVVSAAEKMKVNPTKKTMQAVNSYEQKAYESGIRKWGDRVNLYRRAESADYAKLAGMVEKHITARVAGEGAPNAIVGKVRGALKTARKVSAIKKTSYRVNNFYGETRER
jgi:hypothetical protein